MSLNSVDSLFIFCPDELSIGGSRALKSSTDTVLGSMTLYLEERLPALQKTSQWPNSSCTNPNTQKKWHEKPRQPTYSKNYQFREMAPDESDLDKMSHSSKSMIISTFKEMKEDMNTLLNESKRTQTLVPVISIEMIKKK